MVLKCLLRDKCDDVYMQSQLAEFNPGPVLRCGPAGEIQYANNAAIEIFGMDKSKKPTLCQIFPCSENVNIANCIKNGSVIEFSAPVGSRHFQFLFRGVPKMGVVHIYGADVTSQKEAEQKVTLAKTRAEEATRLKDEFVSLVAHDLKSPFNSIIGMLRLLTNDKKKPLDDDQKAKLEKALSASYGMVEMIDKLLDINRLQSGELSPRPERLELLPIAEAVIGKLYGLAEAKGVGMENMIPENLFVHADPDLFSVVLQNLVSNAIKFCKRGDKVGLFIEGEGRARLVVRDTGAGMSAETLARLFEKGGVVSTPGTNGERGTGLGLKFSYDIMRAHGGLLSATSAKGEGSAFYVEFKEVEFSAIKAELVGA